VFADNLLALDAATRSDDSAAARLQCVHDVRLVCASQKPSQLKALQEVITLSVFVPFALLYMRQPIKTDFLWAGLCLVGAVYFVFRG
jgi:uncharacterized protein (DUF486 family)